MNAPALFMALFNGAWQGALLCLVAFALLRAFRRLNAATRYTIWSALLVISLLLPVANYAFSVKAVTHVVKLQSAGHLGAVARARVPSPSLFGLVNRSGNGTRALPTSSLSVATPTLYERVIPAVAKLADYAIFALLALLLVALARLAILWREIVRMIRARRTVRLGTSQFLNATNFSFAFYKRMPMAEIYFAYGNPNMLNTQHDVILKLIQYFGAEKGT
jgi:multisubunit Na+/H+ antiporter MnhG subunit